MNKIILSAAIILGVGFSACANKNNSNSKRRENGNFKKRKSCCSFEKH